MRIEIPDFSIVALVGASGSGKSTFAAQNFAPTEILSSDAIRGMISDNELNQECSADAFECLYKLAEKRMDRRKLTVIDASNITKQARRELIEFARRNNCLADAIVLDIPEQICLENNKKRPDRQVPNRVIRHQVLELKRVMKDLRHQGFRKVHIFNSLAELDSVVIDRVPLWTDRRDLGGPFDIIGDVHGCYDELCELLEKLGYKVLPEQYEAIPPDGRTAIFLGDLCDRGPASVPVLKLAMNMQKNGNALCVPGNHDEKLLRHLDGKKVNVAHGLEKTLSELAGEDKSFIHKLKAFLSAQVSHYLLDNGRLVAAHAGLPEKMQGRASRSVREFCIYGDVDGETDSLGLPVRKEWEKDYRGQALVTYAHTPCIEPTFINNTICLDAGCVFGGKLAALRYPEMEITKVAAKKEYYPPVRPISKKQGTDLLNIGDFTGRKHIETGLGPTIIIEPENSLAALESIGRYGVDPHWLLYIPPTMSPCETSSHAEYLEHPLEALDYYGKRGINQIICEEKHMGSRAVAIICKDLKAARRIYPDADCNGIIYTRTGRPFFIRELKNIGDELLADLTKALTASSFWEDFSTDWACLDCEILPWSLKAEALIQRQYAPFGQTGKSGLAESLKALQKRRESGSLADSDLDALKNFESRLKGRLKNLNKYDEVWRSYCKTVNGPEDTGIAPFHIMATEGHVWTDVPHPEHLRIIEKCLGNAKSYIHTRNIALDLNSPSAREKATSFWKNLIEEGSEGMVVKPVEFLARQNGTLLQPAIKCRGRDYLRIVYAPDYLDNLPKFKKRPLGAKRGKALREFCLGIEALTRYASGQPLYKVHECSFGVLALESEPSDAKL